MKQRSLILPLMLRGFAAGVVGLALALVWAPGAPAATLGGTAPLLYDDAADTANNSVLVAPYDGATLTYSGTPTLTASSPCTQASITGAKCPNQAAYSFAPCGKY